MSDSTVAITILTKKEFDELAFKIDNFDQETIVVKMVLSEVLLSLLSAYSREEKFEFVMQSEDKVIDLETAEW